MVAVYKHWRKMQRIIVDYGVLVIDGRFIVFLQAPELQCWGSGSNKAYVDLHDVPNEFGDTRGLFERLWTLPGLDAKCIKKKDGWNAMVISAGDDFNESLAESNIFSLLSELFGCQAEKGLLTEANMEEIYLHRGKKVKPPRAAVAVA